MSDIYFTSDTHFNHKNIVRSITSWDKSHQYNCRDFSSLEEHNQALVDNINSLVKEDDTLYHLGDWSFGEHENIEIFRRQLICKDIHLVLGNHDQHISPSSSPYRKLFSSTNQTLELNLKLDCKRTGQYGKQLFFLSHYSHQIWNKSHHGSIHLFGHSHGGLIGLGKSMDVGVDTNNFYPYHIEEILYNLKDVEVHKIDHHNIETN